MFVHVSLSDSSIRFGNLLPRALSGKAGLRKLNQEDWGFLVWDPAAIQKHCAIHQRGQRSLLQELESFNQFARGQIDGGRVLTIDELFDQWRNQHNESDRRSSDLLAIQGAIDDFEKGDRGRPAGELSRELRERHGLS